MPEGVIRLIICNCTDGELTDPANWLYWLHVALWETSDKRGVGQGDES